MMRRLRPELSLSDSAPWSPTSALAWAAVMCGLALVAVALS
jgi:hypothetical protein